MTVAEALALGERTIEMIDEEVPAHALERAPEFFEDIRDKTQQVLETIRANYPTLDIPFHARWRHFTVAGLDRWALLDKAAHFADARERGRAAYDLAVVSVLLDAGANAECSPEWLVQFAQMGTTFARTRYGIETPNVGLLSIGEEPTKGSPLVKETHQLLAEGSWTDACGGTFVGLEEIIRRRLGTTRIGVHTSTAEASLYATGEGA